LQKENSLLELFEQINELELACQDQRNQLSFKDNKEQKLDVKNSSMKSFQSCFIKRGTTLITPL
jgi:hypothetical protein